MNIEVRHLYKNYEKTPVLDDLCVEFPLGARSLIMGPSGVGKTTLMRILAGLEEPTAGEIKGIPSPAYLFFSDLRLLESASIRANLLLLHPLDDDACTEVLQWVELDAISLDTKVSSLSKGMKQRLALARFFLLPGSLFLLDEPFQSLDLPLAKRILQHIQQHYANKTLILSTHQPELAKLWEPETTLYLHRPDAIKRSL